jgi:hypothetical protein
MLAHVTVLGPGLSAGTDVAADGGSAGGSCPQETGQLADVYLLC